MVDIRVQVEYCFEVFDSIMQDKKKGIKIYKNKKNAQRYISQWLDKSSNHVCRSYEFERKQWFTHLRT